MKPLDGDAEWLRDFTASADLPGRRTRGPACLAERTLAGLVDGTLEPADRAEAVAHLSECARCRGAVASLARAMSDPLVAREVAAIERKPATARTALRRRYAGMVIPVAAALALIVVRPWRSPDVETPHRASVTGAVIPVARMPVGTVARADTFRWGAVASADRYRLTLFDSAGGIAYETELTDTVALLPDSIVLAVGRRYLWRVDARIGWERWSQSALVEFSIGGTSR